MKPSVKNLIELQQRNPYAVEIVTEEFFEDENIIRIRSLIMVDVKRKRNNNWSQRSCPKKSRNGFPSRFREFFGKQIHIELYGE
jgi:GTP-binding protein Era